jgi:acyl dehydratase
MSIDLSFVGFRYGPMTTKYDWRDVALYALAVGAGENDLAYLLEQPPLKVLPTFGVLSTFQPVCEAGVRAGATLPQMLHTAQRIELVKPFPAHGEIQSSAAIRGIWDMKVGALMIFDTETLVNGELACKTTWQLLLRGEGGFGGERPPQSLRTRAPKGKAPDFEVEVPTSRSQALLYRLTGDVNPIHSHPEIAKQMGFERPILHGLCTYGIGARVALKELAGNDPARFKAFEAKFSKVVMPGDTLVVRGYLLETPGQAAVTVTVKESGEEAISNALFEYV